MVRDFFLEIWSDMLLAPVTTVLLLLTIAVSVVGFLNKRFLQRCTLHPYSVYRGKYVYTLLTAGFVHKNGWHLLINGFVIFYAPGFLEERLVEMSGAVGHFQFALFYLFFIAGGNYGSVLWNRNNFMFSSLGASTAVFGAMAAIFLLLAERDPFVIFPFFGSVSNLYLYFYLLAAALGVLIFRKKDKYDHAAHFASVVIGGLVALLMNPFWF